MHQILPWIKLELMTNYQSQSNLEALFLYFPQFLPAFRIFTNSMLLSYIVLFLHLLPGELEGTINIRKATALISSKSLIAWLRASLRDRSLHLKLTPTDLALFQSQCESLTLSRWFVCERSLSVDLRSNKQMAEHWVMVHYDTLPC